MTAIFTKERERSCQKRQKKLIGVFLVATALYLGACLSVLFLHPRESKTLCLWLVIALSVLYGAFSVYLWDYAFLRNRRFLRLSRMALSANPSPLLLTYIGPEEEKMKNGVPCLGQRFRDGEGQEVVLYAAGPLSLEGGKQYDLRVFNDLILSVR